MVCKDIIAIRLAKNEAQALSSRFSLPEMYRVCGTRLLLAGFISRNKFRS